MAEHTWIEVARQLGESFGERAAAHDSESAFVTRNYAELKREKAFSMLVPAELGGGGASLTQTCEFLYELGRHCASTALALSMHQHLVAAAVFKHLRGQPGRELLERIATEQLVLVSTGATDWVQSNGQAHRVEGGYRVSGHKPFGSGCSEADLLITSFAVEDHPEGPSVIHCPIPLRAEGVRRLDDWHTLGMRGTGSHTLVLEDVFVPDRSITLRRPRNQWHPAWDVVIGVAAPIYMSPYAGLAAAATEQALARARGKQASASLVLSVGRLQNARTAADLVWRDMLRLGADLAFTPSLENTDAQLKRKTLLTTAVKDAVARAVEVAGGSGYYRSLPFERMWRDAQAAHYHPLPESRQWLFSGRVALGQEHPWDV